MIFVTVGTHEQQFNRLIKKIDELVENGIIKERVVQQIGYSTYIPKYTEYRDFFDYEIMEELENESDIIITHGGPSTFMGVLSKGKIPIVVPRQYKYGEHVNNHQLEFARKVKKEGYKIIVVEDLQSLEQLIVNERKNILSFQKEASHNEKFMTLFFKEINEMFN